VEERRFSRKREMEEAMFRKRVTTLISPLIAAAGLLVFGTAPVSAAPVIFVFSGADFSVDPTHNTGGSLTVTISDIMGGVQLQIDNNLVDAGAFPREFYFNTTAAPLAGAVGSCVACGAIGAPLLFSFGTDAYKADGDGLYDIHIQMDNAPPAERLTPGESATLKILSGTAGFNAASFLTLSAPDGGHGPFLAAVHVQELPNGGGDWLAPSAPEPGLLLLFGMGLIATGRMAARKSKSRT
jgi:hypothetical protein